MPELRGRALMTAVLTLTSLGFFMIGYDNGLFGGFVEGESFQVTFGRPRPAIVGLIVGIYEIGCFLGSVATALVGDHLGRRRTMMVGVVTMMVGAVLQGTSSTLAHMIVGRVVCGIGMGFINSTGPVLQAEFSPKTIRGLFVCVQISTLNFGIMLVYWINYALVHSPRLYAWRIPVLLQLVFLFAMLALCFVIPESPRWLVSRGRPDEAFDILSRLKGDALNERQMRRLCRDIISAVHIQSQKGADNWKDLFKRDSLHSRRRFLIACAIQAMQQLGGINAIIFYSGTVFRQSLRFSAEQAAVLSGLLQTWFFLASFIPWRFIDRIGRRPLLLSMIAVMALCFAAQSALVYQIERVTAAAFGSGIAAAAVLFVYQGAFTIGFQATVWVYPSEILPIHLRQRGSAVSTASNWLCNYAVVQVAPVALSSIGYRTYILFAALNLSFLPAIYLFFPETTGLELEDVDDLFGADPSGRSASVQLSLRARRRRHNARRRRRRCLRLSDGGVADDDLPSDDEDSTFPSRNSSAVDPDAAQFPRGHLPPASHHLHRSPSARLGGLGRKASSASARPSVVSPLPLQGGVSNAEWPPDAWTWFSDADNDLGPGDAGSGGGGGGGQKAFDDKDEGRGVVVNATPALPERARRREAREARARGVGRLSPQVEHVEDEGALRFNPTPRLPRAGRRSDGGEGRSPVRSPTGRDGTPNTELSDDWPLRRTDRRK